MLRRLAFILISAALYWPATAAAHGRAHRAQTPAQLIQKAMGPETTVSVCWPIRLGVRCDYSTSSINIGVWWEAEANGWKPESGIWSSYADVVRGKVFFAGLESY